jgi:hypothetical protein
MINSTYYFTLRNVAATTKAHPTVDDRNFEFRFYAYRDPELTVKKRPRLSSIVSFLGMFLV